MGEGDAAKSAVIGMRTFGFHRLAKLHDTHATSFTRCNFLVTAVDCVMEFVEAFSLVAIRAPLARSRQEAILSFERANDDPHCVSGPCHFVVLWDTAAAARRQLSALLKNGRSGMRGPHRMLRGKVGSVVVRGLPRSGLSSRRIWFGKE
jgi:hypothetical protein